ncbi:MAG TPA: penicillin acylase family protein, partial [Pilimelia sp.]|nr:penicillin acylase family protein [Pilimelia sp.]
MTRHLTRAGAATAAAGLLVAGLLAGPAPASGTTTEKTHGYVAQIRRASYGVPHVTAANFGSLGFGTGYAQAEDNICVIAERVVTVDATRSLF